MEQAFYWYWFVNIPGIGARTRKRLLDAFGSPSRLYPLGQAALSPYLTAKQWTAFDRSRDVPAIRTSMERLREEKVRFLHWESEDYPKRFRSLYDPPLGLYRKGRLPQEERLAIAIVGARNATAYGRRAAHDFAQALAGRGVQIISGLAAGIDAAGHRGALDAGGYTLGILGGGIDTVYPRTNFNLYMELYRRGGVLSEYNLGIPNHSGLFPIRNRLISALADGILVVEAGERSGSLITADQALEQGRDVFAVPGRATDAMSRGCNNLIAQGAILVQTPEDILRNYPQADISGKTGGKDGIFGRRRAEERPASPEEKAVYEETDAVVPASFDELAGRTGLSPEALRHALTVLELKGLVCQRGQNQYLRVL